jgi:hypothetical protein
VVAQVSIDPVLAYAARRDAKTEVSVHLAEYETFLSASLTQAGVCVNGHAE